LLPVALNTVLSSFRMALGLRGFKIWAYMSSVQAVLNVLSESEYI
jgi:hypothetical protein